MVNIKRSNEINTLNNIEMSKHFKILSTHQTLSPFTKNLFEHLNQAFVDESPLTRMGVRFIAQCDCHDSDVFHIYIIGC